MSAVLDETISGSDFRPIGYIILAGGTPYWPSAKQTKSQCLGHLFGSNEEFQQKCLEEAEYSCVQIFLSVSMGSAEESVSDGRVRPAFQRLERRAKLRQEVISNRELNDDDGR